MQGDGPIVKTGPIERERERNSSGPPKPSVIHLPVLKDLDSMRAKK